MSDLPASRTAIADASGRAVVQLGPQRAHTSWHITNTAISSTSTTIPEFRLYKGAEAPSSLIAASYTGTINSNSDVYDVPNGMRVIGVWSRCDVGAQCTITLDGEQRGR